MQNDPASLEKLNFLESETYIYHVTPRIPLLESYSKQMQTYIHQESLKSHTQMLTAAFIITTATWKLHRCPSVRLAK